MAGKSTTFTNFKHHRRNRNPIEEKLAESKTLRAYQKNFKEAIKNSKEYHKPKKTHITDAMKEVE